MIPTCREAGRVGGTVIVNRSRNFMTISSGVRVSRKRLIKMQYPITENKNKMKINLRDSWKKVKV